MSHPRKKSFTYSTCHFFVAKVHDSACEITAHSRRGSTDSSHRYPRWLSFWTSCLWRNMHGFVTPPTRHTTIWTCLCFQGAKEFSLLELLITQIVISWWCTLAGTRQSSTLWQSINILFVPSRA
jgi:hypothetical protein